MVPSMLGFLVPLVVPVSGSAGRNSSVSSLASLYSSKVLRQEFSLEISDIAATRSLSADPPYLLLVICLTPSCTTALASLALNH